MLLQPVLLLMAILGGWTAAAWVVDVSGVAILESAWRDRLAVVLTAGAAGAGAAIALVARRRPGLAADAGVVAAGVLLAAASTAALHGTRWGWYGLYADSSFRTQMVTRYAETAALVDYGYRDLPAHYPPALGWLSGRLAAVTDVAGWEAVKPAQLLVGALVPLAAYLLWRPVVGALTGSAVAGLATVWTAHLQKPDEWLVLACLLPLWLLAVRDLRAPGFERWSAWRLGVVLGLLLLFHTYWFLPFGVATLLALGYDAVHARRGQRPAPRLPLRRAWAIGAVGLAVSAVSWVPVVAARLRLPSDSLQLRYSYSGGNVPPVPSPLEASELAGLVGLAWLAWAAWRRLRWRDLDDRTREVTGALGLALAGCLVTLGLGALAEQADVGLLAFKTKDAVLTVLLAAGVLGSADWLRRWVRRREGGHPARARAASLAPAVLAAAAAATAGYSLADRWVTGGPALVAQTTRYPDGSVPTGDAAQEPYIRTLFVHPSDPSVAAVPSAWRSLRPDVPLSGAVLVTTRVDLLATTPVHGFVAYKSIDGRLTARCVRCGLEMVQLDGAASAPRCRRWTKRTPRPRTPRTVPGRRRAGSCDARSGRRAVDLGPTRRSRTRVYGQSSTPLGGRHLRAVSPCSEARHTAAPASLLSGGRQRSTLPNAPSRSSKAPTYVDFERSALIRGGRFGRGRPGSARGTTSTPKRSSSAQGSCPAESRRSAAPAACWLQRRDHVALDILLRRVEATAQAEQDEVRTDVCRLVSSHALPGGASVAGFAALLPDGEIDAAHRSGTPGDQ